MRKKGPLNYFVIAIPRELAEDCVRSLHYRTSEVEKQILDLVRKGIEQQQKDMEK